MGNFPEASQMKKNPDILAAASGDRPAAVVPMEAVAPEDAVFQRCNGPDAMEEELEEQLAFSFIKDVG